MSKSRGSAAVSGSRRAVWPLPRVLRALDLLQRHPGLTAAELARSLGVSARAARRYVATLRKADIAVESAATT